MALNERAHPRGPQNARRLEAGPTGPTPGGGSPPPKTLLLHSGGLDSTTLLAELLAAGIPVTPLFIRYGQTAEEAEAQAVEELAGHYAVKPLTLSAWAPDARRHGTIPNRNLTLFTLALSVALDQGYDMIAMGINAGDGAAHPDGREEARQAMAALPMMTADQPVALVWPYAALWKPEIAAKAFALDVPAEKTWSCWGAGPEPCHDCRACRLADALTGDPFAPLPRR